MARKRSLAINSDKLRVSALENGGRYHVRFEFKQGSAWRVAAATGIPGGNGIHSKDPTIEWNNGNWPRSAYGLYDEAHLENGNTLVLRGGIADSPDQPRFHDIVQRVSLVPGGVIRVKVTDTVGASSEVQLSRLTTSVYFTPDDRTSRGCEPLDFAWIPNLHWEYDDVVADHVFRSPAAIVQFQGVYAALVPDLDLLAKARPVIRHALDLRCAGMPTSEDSPAEWRCTSLQYGFCTWEPYLHVFYKHRQTMAQNVTAGPISYGFDLFIGHENGPEKVVSKVNRHLWKRYGKKHFKNIRPQVMPFEEYGRQYAYKYELPLDLGWVTLKGKKCAGITGGRRGANFHAWENHMVLAFGMRHYGGKWRNRKLRAITDGIRQLILCSPRKQGAFPCIFNFDTGKFEGTIAMDAPCDARDPYTGYDTAAMGVTAWWMLHWCDHFGIDAELLEHVTSYAWFLVDKQLESGAIPTWFDAKLASAPTLRESGTTAISGAVLARIALMNGDAALKKAALAAGRFIDTEVLPQGKFHDFETFYSCSLKPYGWKDPVSGIEPQNTLSIQWTCDQFLALYKLTGDRYWLKRGEYALDLLAFFHQVWAPPYYRAYVFGGFASMNTDGEWNDGRQSRFAHTFADYYETTGKVEYLERAVSACRASFAQMDMDENHDNAINFTVQRRLNGKPIGVATENMYHDGPGRDIGGWSGLNWSAGGGLTTSAYLERKFGGVLVDMKAKKIIPIDGVNVTVKSWKPRSICLNVKSALRNLPHPYKKSRKITVRFGRPPDHPLSITLNGRTFRNQPPTALAKGLDVTV